MTLPTRLARCVAPLAALLCLAAPADAQPRWYRGNTHTHTTESDGNAPPMAVARWYKEHGYDFVVITDHEKVTDVAPLNDSLAALGRFLVIRGQEVTQRVFDPARPTDARQAHVNAVGVARPVLPLGERGLARETTIAATYARNLAAIRAAGGLAQVNHPNWRWSVVPDDMAALPDSTLFELWNGHAGVNNLGGADESGRVALSTEALWDTLLTRGRLLFGVADDDAHEYKREQLEDPYGTRPGKAWVMVRADTLTPEAIVRALGRGDFYASTGIALAAYEADARGVRLRVARRSTSDDRRITTRFIGRGGRVLAEVAGVEARYDVRGDEGYVRAAIVDSNGQRAWTQPVRVAGTRD